MRVLLVCLLLSCALTLAWAGLVLEGGGPIMWTHTTGDLKELPITDDMLTPNPWHYLHRMSLYRILIAHTDPYMGSMGPGENQSPIWGLPLQLGWMLTSGRLADPTGHTLCGTQEGDPLCISPSSWWGCVNYVSSVLPFLSAAKADIMGPGIPVQMQVPDGWEGYCATYDACKAAFPNVMKNWDDFFQGLKDAQTSPLPDNEKKDALLGLYWNAQLSSTKLASAANPICKDMLNSYSGVERSFAESWLSAGEYVAAVHFQSNLELAAGFMVPLPGRILKDGDSAPNIPDLTAEENHSLYIFSWIKSLDTILFGGLSSTWRSAMCSVQSRESGRDMLTQLLHNSTYSTEGFFGLVSSLATSCP